MSNQCFFKLYVSKNMAGLNDAITVPQTRLDPFLVAAWAVKDDDANILNMALQYCDPLQNDSMLLRQAVEFGSPKCFDVLLPLSNPLARNSEALQWAIYYDRGSMFERLVNVCNVAAALYEIDTECDGAVVRRAHTILEERNAKNQAFRIENAVIAKPDAPKTKKI